MLTPKDNIMSKEKKKKDFQQSNLKKNLLKDFFYLEHDKIKPTYFELITTAFLYVFLSVFALIISNQVYGDITETKFYTLISMFGIWLILMML